MSDYRYEGLCPRTGRLLSLPRTDEAKEQARELMQQLDPHPAEGRMYGVLLTQCGRVLRAFSGLVQARGWVPPIPAPKPTALESSTITRLAVLKEELGKLANGPNPENLRAHWQEQTQLMEDRHKRARQSRCRRRQNGEQVDDESRADGREWRQFKEARKAALEPLERAERARLEQILAIKRERRELSRTLQAELHAAFSESLFGGESWSLASLFPEGPPTGVGECCAPKLLYHAGVQGLAPVARAEFWWGPPPPGGGRRHGQFYGACKERCQPLIGPLLSRPTPLLIVHEDADLIVVEKPSGLLTVPGRRSWNQDSLAQRLGSAFLTVHRLDLETSGLVLFARNPQTQAALHRQFEAREVEKIYLAQIDPRPAQDEGIIDAALAPDPERPGRYRLHSGGKYARTRYRMLDEGNIELHPETGRSHQLRVHLAQALGCPIRGDRLYGGAPDVRLRLHAAHLTFTHPTTGQQISVSSSLSYASA